MAETERATEDMSKNWEDRVAESKKDVKVCFVTQSLWRIHKQPESVCCQFENCTLLILE